MHLNNINAYKLFILAFSDLEQTYTVHKEILKKRRKREWISVGEGLVAYIIDLERRAKLMDL